LANVLHDWPDAEATTILQNIRKVMGQNSRVLIRESICSSVLCRYKPTPCAR
jgi:hypothetical protein